MIEEKMIDNKMTKGAFTILRAAELVFSRQGYKATAISDIAKAVGGSKANIYHHFKSKQDLYQKALQMACETTFNIMDPSVIDETLPAKLRLKAYIALHLQSLLENPSSTNLIKRELMDNNQFSGKLVAQEIFTQAFRQFEALVIEARGLTKNVTHISASMQAYSLIAANIFFFDSRLAMSYLPGFSELADSPEYFSEQLYEIIMNKVSEQG